MKRLAQLIALLILALGLTIPINTAQAQLMQKQSEDYESFGRDIGIQYLKPYDRTGNNIFEMPMETDVEYEGFKIQWGASFRQQWQSLTQENNITDPNSNGFLPELGPGFNTANANLYLDAQVADGMLVHVFTYLSSRHHRETWVKGGYLQIDKFAMIDMPLLDALMKNLRIKFGHYEVNYGDQHYRRSDNALTTYNPFMGNLIMDPFTTEIGAEFQYINNGLLGTLQITGGEIAGDVTDEESRAISWIGKIGFDNMYTENFDPDGLRFRLTGSFYATAKSNFNTLYFGDRAGSHYFGVIDPGLDTDAENDFSGRFNPGLHDEVTSFMVNPYVKYRDLELFGTFETTSGTGFDQSFNGERDLQQFAIEAVYYLFPNDNVSIGARYNKVDGQNAFTNNDVNISRVQLAGTWYITNNILLKLEYVDQDYDDFAAGTARDGAEFDGIVLEGSISW